ncbi:Putative Bacteriophage CI-repressor protein [Avibacterium paragallinarum JF4211]|nr:Putative Bacteriophage CI-repressor protein [Avibacterium paragallinarum JF4211]
MKIIAAVKEDQELAEILNIKKSTISNWKRGTAISIAYFSFLSQKYDADLNWLLTGQKKDQELSTQEKMALIAFNDLDERGKVEAIAYMSGIRNKATSISQIVQGSSNNVVGTGNIHIMREE